MSTPRSILLTGETLRLNEFLTSANGFFIIIMQSDGNLCEYTGASPDQRGDYVWGQGVSHLTGNYFAIMQDDGNLCVYQGDGPENQGQLIWNAGTTAPGKTFFAVLQNDANFCVYKGTPDNNQGLLWQSAVTRSVAIPAVNPNAGFFFGGPFGGGISFVPPFIPMPPVPRTALHTGEILLIGQSIGSADGMFTITMNSDGRLKETEHNSSGDQKEIWRNTNQPLAASAFYAIMRSDGNLCIYVGTDPSHMESGAPVWQTGSSGPGSDFFAAITPDGMLAVFTGTDSNNRTGMIWQAVDDDTPDLPVEIPVVLPVPVPMPVPVKRSDLKTGDVLLPGEFLSSPNERFHLVMEDNGILSLYEGPLPGSPQNLVWTPPVQPSAGEYCATLVGLGLAIRQTPAVPGQNPVRWQTFVPRFTDGNPVLRLQDDGVLRLFALPGNAAPVLAWSSSCYPDSISAFMVCNRTIDLFVFPLYDGQQVQQMNWDGFDQELILPILRSYQRVLRVVKMGNCPEGLTIATAIYNTGITSARDCMQPGGGLSLVTAVSPLSPDVLNLFLRTNQVTTAEPTSSPAFPGIMASALVNSARNICLQANHLMAVASNTTAPYYSSMKVSHVGEQNANYFESISGYDQLFGNPDYGECDECNSIFGAAAFFVDLMHIADKGVTADPAFPQLTLLARRPDLSKILLNCDNTNTTIPYLQIVNEVLEGTVVSQLGNAVDTDPYRLLATTPYPLNLPYHAPLNEIRNFLPALGTSVSEIIKAFDQPDNDSFTLALERTQMSMEEVDLVVNPATTDELVSRYGLVSIDAITLQKLSLAKTLMAQTGFSRQQLNDLFHQNLGKTERATDRFFSDFFINRDMAPGAYADIKIEIAQDDLVEESERINNLDQDKLDRISRFTRMATKLGWKFEELDWVLLSLGKADLDKPILEPLSQIKFLADKYKIPVITLCTAWFDIKTSGTGDANVSVALFDTVINPLASVSKGNYYRPLTVAGHELYINPLYTDAVLSWAAGKDIINALDGSNDDIASIANNFFPDLTGVKLDVSTLSLLFRYSTLPKYFGLPINDFLALLRIAGKQNQTTLSPAELIALMDTYAWIKTTGFNPYELDYVLNHQLNDITGPYVAKMYSQDSLNKFLQSFNLLLAPALITADSFRKNTLTQDQSSAVLFELQNDNYIIDNGIVVNRVPAGWTPAVQLSADQIAFVTHTVNSAYADQQGKAEQSLATFFKVPTILLSAIIGGIAVQYRVQNLALLLLSVTVNDTIERYIITLSRWLLVSQRIGLDADEVTHIFTMPAIYGFVPEEPLTLAQLQNFWKFKLLVNTFRDDENELISILEQKVDSPMVALMNLTQWNKEDCNYLCTALFSGQDPCTDIAHLYCIKQCIDISTKTQLDIAFIDSLRSLPAAWVNDANWPLYEQASQKLLNALEVFAGDDQWTVLFAKVNAPLLEQKRTALTAFVLDELNRIYTDIDTPRKLYEFLLIDTEMSGITEVSYIRQALNSVQLYLQRCRMNLEKAAVINTAYIHETWWEWMMNYRVWEANRKVFMYPENYIDPGLRKSKTDLFAQLENDLQQGDINAENAEAAFTSYLVGFEQLAKLQYVDALNCKVNDAVNGEVDTLFLFAKTHTDPTAYYYIAREGGNVWSQWNKINITIPAEYITPVYAFHKLFIFWSEIKTHDENDQTTTASNAKATITKASIRYTFCNAGGKWVAPQTLQEDMVVNIQSTQCMHQPFDELIFQPDQMHWQKPLVTVLSPAVIPPSLRATNQEEKIIINYGPLINNTAVNGFASPAYTEAYTGPFRAFEDALNEMRYLVNFSRQANLYGSWSLFGMSVLDIDLNLASYTGADDILFIPLNPAPERNLSALKISHTDALTFVQCVTTSNTIYSNYINDQAVLDTEQPAPQNLVFAVNSPNSMPSVIQVKNNPGMSVFMEQGESFLLTVNNNVEITDSIVTTPFDYHFVTPKSFVTAKYNLHTARAMFDILAALSIVDPRTGDVLQTHQTEDGLIGLVVGGLELNQIREANLAAIRQLNNEYQLQLAIFTVYMASKQAEWSDNFIRRALFPNGYTTEPDVVLEQSKFFAYRDDINRRINYLNTLINETPDLAAQLSLVIPVISDYASVVVKKLQSPHLVLSIGHTGTSFPEPQLIVQRISTNAVNNLSHRLFAGGIDSVLSYQSQEPPSGDESKRLFNRLNPGPLVTQIPTLPTGDQVDFDGPYGNYYWELFFHAPMLVAKMLNNNQQFQDAQKWLQYIFNPTVPLQPASASLPNPAMQSWQFYPFRQTKTLETVSQQIANQAELKVYNDDPFDPHAIARLRIGAYEKSVVMQYIDNLLDWGDNLFGQYTWESLTTATMLYVYAYDVLGQRPEEVGVVKEKTPLTYQAIKDFFTQRNTDIPQFFVELENAVYARMENATPDQLVKFGNEVAMPVNNMDAYFCIPENDQFVGYWDKVEDRLYKIRHGLNLQGIAQPLALFDPPIDPMLLVRAAASGNNILDILSQTQAQVPNYRFSIMIEKAKGFTQTLIQLGNNLLSALEKNDAETLSVLRSTQEIAMLNMSTQIKQQQIVEQQHTLDGLTENLNSAQYRLSHYQGLLNTNINGLEIAGLALLAGAVESQATSVGIKGVSLAGYLMPNIYGLADGGSQFGDAINVGSQMLDGLAGVLSQTAGIINTTAQYQRRAEEWDLQQNIAQYEINNISAQIAATNTRIAMAQQELAVQQKNIDNANAIDDFLKSKFSNAQLYQWMTGRIATLYFETYKIVSEMAMLAQGAYNFELDRNDTFITFDAWDSLHKGLLAGEGLMFALQQMERAYLTNNTRRFEIEKTISLRQWSPDKFLAFKYGGAGVKGEIDFDLTQAMFDFDFPGHYSRKIKSVSVSIPAIAGPYQGINATLTQNTNALLTTAEQSGAQFLLDRQKGSATNVRQNWVPAQQIALSKGIDDNGMFVLDFRDERYLPFEGTGAVSNWTLSMPPETNRINFDSISDVLVKVHYTALNGGQQFTTQVRSLYGSDAYNYLQAKIINLKQAFPASWQQLVATKTTGFKITDDYVLPNLLGVSVKGVLIQVLPAAGANNPLDGHTFTLNGDSTKTSTITNNTGSAIGPLQQVPAAWSLACDTTIDETVAKDVVVVVIYEANPFKNILPG